MSDKDFTKEDFIHWLEHHDITIKQLSIKLDVSRSLLDKYRDGSAEMPLRFRYALDGVLFEILTKAKEGLNHD